MQFFSKKSKNFKQLKNKNVSGDFKRRLQKCQFTDNIGHNVTFSGDKFCQYENLFFNVIENQTIALGIIPPKSLFLVYIIFFLTKSLSSGISYAVITTGY